MTDDWAPLRQHYEECLKREGATPKGVDWPNGFDLAARFQSLLAILEPSSQLDTRPIHLLDLGCGPGLLLDYLAHRPGIASFEYYGIDISWPMVLAARQRWPEKRFEVRDIVSDPLADQSVDIVVMNGVLTEKQGISREKMISLAESLIDAAFRASRLGIAFNVMSKHVDWEREDLFHWGFDEVANFLKSRVSRHFLFKSDYALYEFTTYVYRSPKTPDSIWQEKWWK